MKNKAAGLLKQIMSVITSMAKSKILAAKSKTRAIKTRLIIFSLLRNKKILMSSISDKLQALMGHDHHHLHQYRPHNLHREDESKSVTASGGDGSSNAGNGVLFLQHESVPNPTHTATAAPPEEEELEQRNEKYPADDGDDETEMGAGAGSVIEMVKKSRGEGEEFRLEDEIDQVADLFIQRFHRQMRIQKQLSMERYKEMLDRSS